MGERSANPLRVGIIGVTAGVDYRSAGWANVAHLPALAALDSYEVRAIASRNPASAEGAAAMFGVPSVYATAKDMAAASDIDLVVVTVRVPAHFDIVMACLGQDKPVFCEWPLANGLDEAEAIVSRAEQKQLRCGVGLQARGSPVIRYARDLIAEGFVGEVLSTSMLGTGMNWGPGMPLRNDYTLEKANGATLLTIVVGHALDALEHCLGPISALQAMGGLRRSEIVFPEVGRTLKATAEDQWIIGARLGSGAMAAVQFRGGMVPGDNLRWEINGTKGDLVITSPFGNVQPFGLMLAGSQNGHELSTMQVPARYLLVPDLPDPALNVAQHYALFAQMSPESATFADALHIHRLLDAVQRSSDQGCRMVRKDGAAERWGATMPGYP